MQNHRDLNFLNWSGGKDSAYCLYQSRMQGLPVDALVTTINKTTGRIAMHGVRRSLLEKQAAAIGLRLYTVELPDQPGMTEYEAEIVNTNHILKEKGFSQAISGDLFLEDLRTYREGLYARDGIECLFPLWKTDTRQMMHDFIEAGFKAIIVCVNGSLLDKSFCGRVIDESFIADLPGHVDPCGENGEYHSFVFDGPIFKQPIAFSKGETVHKCYPAPKSNDEECFTIPQPPADFYFLDLTED
jgi:uncharacterized protein (TIGR00290 family)